MTWPRLCVNLTEPWIKARTDWTVSEWCAQPEISTSVVMTLKMMHQHNMKAMQCLRCISPANLQDYVVDSSVIVIRLWSIWLKYMEFAHRQCVAVLYGNLLLKMLPISHFKLGLLCLQGQSSCLSIFMDHPLPKPRFDQRLYSPSFPPLSENHPTVNHFKDWMYSWILLTIMLQWDYLVPSAKKTVKKYNMTREC